MESNVSAANVISAGAPVLLAVPLPDAPEAADPVRRHPHWWLLSFAEVLAGFQYSMVSTTPPALLVAHRPAAPVVRHPGLGNTLDLLCEDTAKLFFVPAEPPITAVYTAPLTQPTQHGYSHTFDVYFSLIRKLADVGHFHTVTQLLRRSQIVSVFLREPAFIVLMTRYFKAGHPGSAAQLLDEMPHIYNCEPTFQSYNVVLDILVGVNFHKMAVNLFYTMLT